jgi:predicted lipid-binding transport protein (Tim44 family)
MNSGGEWLEVLVFAAIAAFVAWRLYAVLGRRTGEERPPVSDIFAGNSPAPAEVPSAPRPAAEPAPRREIDVPGHLSPQIKDGLRAIAHADASFSTDGFMAGSRQAYQMVLQAYWAGDVAALKPLVSDEVLDMFRKSIEARKAAGDTLENRFVSLDAAELTHAEMDGAMAELTVRFDSKVIAVTRNSSGGVTGSPDTPVVVHDLWTFRRHTRSSDPNWLLVGTDDED